MNYNDNHSSKVSQLPVKNLFGTIRLSNLVLNV